jgi:hypothetical protein
MKRSKKEAKSQPIQVWTLAQAQDARPYIASVVRSLREHALAVIAQRRAVDRLNARPGRPDRAALIALQEAQAELRRSENHMHDAAKELAALDVFSLDPVQATALVPFVHDGQLAWYVFNLFDTDPFRFWRFQSDPEDTRRPVTARQHGHSESTPWA